MKSTVVFFTLMLIAINALAGDTSAPADDSLMLKSKGPYDSKPFSYLKAKMDREINKRNELLDRLKIQPDSQVTSLLESFWQSEMSILYSLDTIVTVLSSANKLEKNGDANIAKIMTKLVDDISYSMMSACLLQKDHMLNVKNSIQNKTVSDEAEQQIDNARKACSLIGSINPSNGRVLFDPAKFPNTTN